MNIREAKSKELSKTRNVIVNVFIAMFNAIIIVCIDTDNIFLTHD